MRLVEVEQNTWVQVVGVTGGMRLQAKLIQYGFFVGDQVRVLRRAPLGGPLLIEVAGREMALGRGVAEKIEVEALV
jgi:Fe2+ transport system protein FeoA